MSEKELKNKELVEKYPFLAWKGNPLYCNTDFSQITYKYTWEDEIPDGWRKAFCPQMWDELKAILEKANYVDKFMFLQIKEKYGTLRLYYSGIPNNIFEEVSKWESKYEDLSEQVCIHCGKPAEVMTPGWISFICKECAKEYSGAVVPIEDIDIFYKDPETYWKSKK